MSISETPVTAERRKARPEPKRRAVQKRSVDGTVLGKVLLDPQMFGLEPNVAVMHQVVTAQLAAARSGTQSTLTRAEVRGGGAKPFRQKGTGRSRQGSTRAPHWSGGGVAMGPKPRSYKQKTPKKMVRLALCSALSDRASEGKVALIDQWGFEEPKTKKAIEALQALGLTGRILLVVDGDDVNTQRSFSNLKSIQVTFVGELSAYDILRNDWIVFDDSTLIGEQAEAASGDEVIDVPDSIVVASSGASKAGASKAGASKAARSKEESTATAESVPAVSDDESGSEVVDEASGSEDSTDAASEEGEDK